MIASRDKALVLRQSELSELQQVAAAASGTLFRTSVSGGPVLSVHATVPTAGWKVFVEMPVAEARAPLWSALVRTASLLALGVLAIALASLASARRSIAIQPARI